MSVSTVVTGFFLSVSSSAGLKFDCISCKNFSGAAAFLTSATV